MWLNKFSPRTCDGWWWWRHFNDQIDIIVSKYLLSICKYFLRFSPMIFLSLFFHMQNLGLVFPSPRTPSKREKLLEFLVSLSSGICSWISRLVTAHAQSESHRNMFYAPAILLQLQLKSPQPQAEQTELDVRLSCHITDCQVDWKTALMNSFAQPARQFICRRRLPHGKLN